jgi:hypothetical protein
MNHNKPSFGKKNQLRMWPHLKVHCSIKYEKLGCPFGIVEKIMINRIQCNLFRKLWILNVRNIKIQVIFVIVNSNKLQTKF